jgi:hypothetical protein
VKYLRHVDKQLTHILENPSHGGADIKAESAAAWAKFRASTEEAEKQLAEAKKADAAKGAEAEAAAKKKMEEGLNEVIDKHDDLKFLAACFYLKENIFQTSPKKVNELVVGHEHVKKCDMPEENAKDPTGGRDYLKGKGLLEVQPGLHLAYSP